MLAGAAIGLLNGVLVVWLRINAVIATLGTLFISRGVANLITDGVPVHQVPPGYNALGVGFLGPVPYPVVVMAIVVVIFTIIGRYSMLGRHAIAIGSAARKPLVAAASTSTARGSCCTCWSA